MSRRICCPHELTHPFPQTRRRVRAELLAVSFGFQSRFPFQCERGESLDYLVALSSHIDRLLVSICSQCNVVCSKLIDDAPVLYNALSANQNHVYTATTCTEVTSCIAARYRHVSRLLELNAAFISLRLHLRIDLASSYPLQARQYDLSSLFKAASFALSDEQP